MYDLLGELLNVIESIFMRHNLSQVGSAGVRLKVRRNLKTPIILGLIAALPRNYMAVVLVYSLLMPSGLHEVD